MTHITYRRFLFRVNDYFLSQGGDTDRSINYYIQCSRNIENSLSEFHTLLVDLRQDQNSIWDGIKPGTRAEIKSFLNNQLHQYSFTTDISQKELIKFMDLFDAFALSKNIRRAERERLIAYNKNKILGVSCILQDNEYVCINFYRITKERATNLHSFTLKGVLKGKNSQSHFGRAHRALHWLDICKFKEAGIHYYDFCGWYSGQEDKALLGINKFKEQFTTHKVKEYSGVIYKNKFLLLLKNLR